MIDNVLYLIHHAVLEKPNTDPPGTEGCHLSPEALGAIVPDHGHFVAFFQSKLNHPKA